MKLIIVDNANTKSFLYVNSQPMTYNWSIAFPPNSKGEIFKVLTPAEYCREAIIGTLFSKVSYGAKSDVRTALSGSKGKGYLVFIYKHIEEDDGYYPKPRAASAAAIHNMKCKLITAHKVLNMVEKQSKFPRSQLIFPSVNPWKKEMEIVIFKVSNRWFYSPYMFSMLILILRSTLFTHIYKLAQIPDLKKLSKKFIISSQTRWSDAGDTKEYAFNTIDFWIPVLKNFKMLHRGTSLIANFSFASYQKPGSGTYSYEGISALVDGNACHKLINDRFNKLIHRNPWNGVDKDG